MPLIQLKSACLAYGHVPLLDHAEMQLDPGERVCLVGRNGAGKSSLMRVINAEVSLDDGEVWRQPGLRVAYLSQEVPRELHATVFEVIAGGLQEIGALLTEFHQVTQQLAHDSSEQLSENFHRLQQQIESQDGWRLEQRVATVISKLDLDAEKKMAELSGGYKRRVMLGRALVQEPELLLLDEPTNHLDIETINWMEEFLLGFNGALLFITHDRTFLRHLATRIIELDRGQLSSWPGNYDRYLEKKEERAAIEAEHNAKFDKKLAQEEVWIRQGIKARRTRNEGRVRALKKLREEHQQRHDQLGKVKMQLDSGELSGKLVIEAENISKTYAGTPLINAFSTTIMRGDRVGIIGPNGAGKSTLLKILLGELAPDSGKVKLGSKLQVAYFDQQRAQLDPEQSVADNLNHGKETITINGKTRHVMSYLQDFLFPPQRVRSPVKSLSGGERNRLLLARLFIQPANLLVLDEPTNDLDVETLELLEDLLSEYDGTLLLVSHDRAFLDNVVTSTIVFEGDGVVEEYVGGYEDWLRQRKSASVAPSQSATENKPSATSSTSTSAKTASKTKLSYKDQRELDQLPDRIEALEQQQQMLTRQVSDPDFYRREQADITATLEKLKQLEQELEQSYARWEQLAD